MSEHLFYQLDKLSFIGGNGQGRRLVRHRNTLLYESHYGIWGGGALILADAHGSVLRAAAATVYTPYGFDDFFLGISTLGFNGEMREIWTGCYMLGTRLFSPILGRFCSRDKHSPFGVGSFNAYAYCEGDPINFTDPEGEAKFNPTVGITHRVKPPTNIKYRLQHVRRARQANAESLKLLGQEFRVGQALMNSKVDKMTVANAFQEGRQLLERYRNSIPKRPNSVPTEDIVAAYAIRTLNEQGLVFSLPAYLEWKYGSLEKKPYGALRVWATRLKNLESRSVLPSAIASSIRSQP